MSQAENIRHEADKILQAISKGQKPSLSLPKRVLANVLYDKKRGFFTLGKGITSRSITSIKIFAQTLQMMALSKEAVETNEEITKREAYYVSKNWGPARFDEQQESDAVIEDLEALFKVHREALSFSAEEKGGEVAGELKVEDKDRETGAKIEIDCSKFGTGAYSIPTNVEHLTFQTNAKFVLAIETAGMFQRLHNHYYWRKSNSILISMGGVPTRACRRFTRRLSDTCNLPVYVFTDNDPWGVSTIYRTLKAGSANAAHINENFCVPRATFLGVTPYDVDDYNLPTHPLTEVDIKRIDDLLKNDPFFIAHKEWQKALKKMASSGVRAEQQSLAMHGLNYVMDTYLPEKLANKNFLP